LTGSEVLGGPVLGPCSPSIVFLSTSAAAGYTIGSAVVYMIGRALAASTSSPIESVSAREVPSEANRIVLLNVILNVLF